MENPRRLHTITIVGCVLLAIAVLLVFVLSQPRTIGDLTNADLQSITNLIAAEISEPILDIHPREDVVVVETGRGSEFKHSFLCKRTRKGWKVTAKGDGNAGR